MRNIIVLIGMISLISMWCTTAQFVQKRERKGPSLGSLKEDCCREFSEVLKLFPDCLRKISIVQDHAVGAIEGYAKDDKEAFCGCASRQKLIACKEQLQRLKAKLKRTIEEFETCITELNKQ